MSGVMGLAAGAARRLITPGKGIYLIGYGDRTKGNLGVHDDLTATALVLESGGKRVGIAALDMLAINEFVVDRIRARIAPMEVLVCCSHTHSGPIAYSDDRSPRRDQEHIQMLVESIVAALQEAQARLTPAWLEFSSGEAEVGINRREKMPDGHMEIGRNPAGARDRSLQVVGVMTPAGRLATLVNYACHGTVLGPGNLLVSADWIGEMRRSVEAELGGLVLFLQGAAANINPDMYWEDEGAYDKVKEQGAAVGEAVLAAVRSAAERLEGNPIRLERVEAWLPTETPVTTRKPPKNYGRRLLAFAHLPGFLAPFADRLLDRRYPWKSIISPRDGYWSVPMRISALRLGELALLTFAAETFTEIGLKVKAASPARRTLFASLADGCISYLHTEDSHGEGGYEVDVAPLAYRYPGRLQAGCEHLAVRAAQEMLAGLWP